MPNDVFDDAATVAEYEFEVLGGKYVCPTTGKVYKKGDVITTGLDLSGFRNKFRLIAKKLRKVVEEVIETVVETVVEEGGKKLEELLSEEGKPVVTDEPEKKPVTEPEKKDEGTVSVPPPEPEKKPTTTTKKK